MRQTTETVRPLAIPRADAPGHLDRLALQRWAERMAAACGPELAQRAGLLARQINSTASILSSVEQWQHAPDAAWLAVHWGPVPGRIAIPMPLAVSVVGRCLGYDSCSEQPLDPLDYEVLIAWLRPVVNWMQEVANLHDRAMLSAGEADLEALGGGPAVLLNISMTVGAAQGTWQLAVPWEALRELVRAEAALRGGRVRAEMAALGGLPATVEAIINGGTLALRESFELEVGDVVALDCDLTTAVELRVGSQPVAAGRLGSHESQWAVRITEIQWRRSAQSTEEAGND